MQDEPLQVALSKSILEKAPISARVADPDYIQVAPRERFGGVPPQFGSAMAALVGRNKSWKQPLKRRAVFASRLSNVRVIGHKNAIVTGDGRLIAETLYQTSREAIAKSLQSSSISRSGDVTGFLIGNSAYWNYYHWLLQCLPSLMLLGPAVTETPALVAPPLSPWQRRSLELAGVAGLKVEEVEKGEVREYEALIYPSILCDRGSYGGIPAFFERIRRRVLDDRPGALLLYVSRRDTKKRKLNNEAELERALESIGFLPIVPSEVSLDEQVRLFSMARLVVGPHGAGMTNIVFCHPGTLVYELHPNIHLNGCFFQASQLFRLAYHADAFAAEAGARRVDTRWSVDIPTVISRVEAILREPR